MLLIIKDESEGIYAFHPIFRLLTLYTCNNKVSIAVESREVLLDPSLFLDPCPNSNHNNNNNNDNNNK